MSAHSERLPTPGTIRLRTLQALRASAQFDISLESVAPLLAAAPNLLHDPQRVAEIEQYIRALLLEGTSIPEHARWSTLPVLGSVAEAFVESMLIDFGWQPLYDDDTGYSAGHGVDLLMLDPSLSAVVAIEVKSTIQRTRWPRLAPTRQAQMTPAWLDSETNEGMRGLSLSSGDVYLMLVQVHLGRLKWRACAASEPDAPRPLNDREQLLDLAWLTERA